MNPDLSKLKLTTSAPLSEQQEQQQVQSQSQTSPSSREFSSVEEMLRFDANQVSPPATLETRLQDSLQQIPPPKRPWWRRWFS